MEAAMQPIDYTNVFVKYLPQDFDDAGLRRLFSPFGPIISTRVMVDMNTGKSLGYGFVKYRDHQHAVQAVYFMTGYKIENKTLLCKLSNLGKFDNPTTNVYIKPLSPDMNEGDLESLFGPFGRIETLKVMRDNRTGESFGIGFVKYETQESATAAVETMNGFKVTEDQPALLVKYAESDIDRAQRKASLPPPQTYVEPPPPVISPTPVYIQTPMVYTPYYIVYNPYPVYPYEYVGPPGFYQ